MNAKPTILIVDDDEGILDTMNDILNEKGFEVAIASDGYKAIEMVKVGTFDVILMDIKMPGINGVETFKRIKAIKPLSRIIFMTAYALEDVVNEAKKEGAAAVLYKPLDIEKLEKMLRNSQANGLSKQKFQPYFQR